MTCNWKAFFRDAGFGMAFPAKRITASTWRVDSNGSLKLLLWAKRSNDVHEPALSCAPAINWKLSIVGTVMTAFFCLSLRTRSEISNGTKRSSYMYFSIFLISYPMANAMLSVSCSCASGSTTLPDIERLTTLVTLSISSWMRYSPRPNKICSSSSSVPITSRSTWRNGKS